MQIKVEKNQANNINYHLITIRNSVNFEISFTDVGAKIYYIAYPDKSGTMGKVTTCCKDMYEFLTTGANYGNSVGRVAGRIKDGVATIAGKEYHFEKNEGNNTLHSASSNYGFRPYEFEIKATNKKTDVVFSLFSPDGDGGFPGNVKVKIIYTIYENKKEVTIHFTAKTDAPTLINLTNHVYFNLNGGTGPIYDQELYLRASKVFKMDQGLILQGLEDVPYYLDYTEPKKLGEHVTEPILVNHRAGGIDHVFVFDGINKSIPSATLYDKATKRKMTMYTSYPAVVVYTDNYPSHRENLAGVLDDTNYGITFESVIPTYKEEDYTFTPEKPYSFVTKYKFN